MSKQITIAVHFCDECPRFDSTACKCHENEDKIIEDKFNIPEWCTLEDI